MREDEKPTTGDKEQANSATPKQWGDDLDTYERYLVWADSHPTICEHCGNDLEPDDDGYCFNCHRYIA